MDDNPWYAPVGKFMLAFGDIEHSTIALLGCLPDCKIPKNAPKLPLGARIDLLREILPRYSAPEYKAVLACLEEVTRQSAFRNLVAHNSIWFDIYKDGDRIMITNHLVSARDRKKKLSLAEMQNLTEKVHSLAVRLSSAALEVMGNYVDESQSGEHE